MSQTLSEVPETVDERPHVEGESRDSLLDTERLERALIVLLTRVGDSRLLVPAASVGLKAERTLRRVQEGVMTSVYHAWRIPTRRDLLVLDEQLSALKYRVAQLERDAGAATRKRGGRR